MTDAGVHALGSLRELVAFSREGLLPLADDDWNLCASLREQSDFGMVLF
jgi:hypothetical protein